MVENDKRLRKANPDIGFVLTGGDLSFVTRKLYNVLIYHSQRLGVGGKGELPFSVDWDLSTLPVGANIKDYFWLPLKDLIDDAAASKNYTIIRDVLQDMMRVTVRRSEPGVWEQISNLISGVLFINASGDATKKGRWAVGWTLPPSLEPLLLNPSAYTRISLYYQSKLSSEVALSLYEVARRYATWIERPRTDTLKWQEWQSILIGNKHPRSEYKLFKRDFLKPAIEEINGGTDVIITLREEFRPGSSRAVESIFFEASLKKQAALELTPAGAVIDVKLIEALEVAGVAGARKFLEEFGEDRCRANLEYYKSTGEKGAGYLVTAIKENYAASASKRLEVAKKAAAARMVATSAAVVDAAATAAVPLPEGEALAVAWAEFCAAPESAPARLGKALPESFEKAKKAAQAAFKLWLAKS